MKIILFLAFIIFVNSLDGGYEFCYDDQYDSMIDSGKQIAEKAIKERLKNENENYGLYSFRTFCQQVNGINIKYIYTCLLNNDIIKTFSVTVYFPMNTNNPQFIDINEGKEITDVENIEEKDEIVSYINQNIILQEEFKYKILRVFENIFDEDSKDRIYYISIYEKSYCYIYKIDQEIINDQNIYSMDSFLSEGLNVNN